MIGRQARRLRLLLERRKLARLEAALGLLGWQQADYDAETQEQVTRLMNCEREQGRLTNESAAIGLEIQKIEERRRAAEMEFAEAQAVALEKERPSAENVDELETQLAARRKERQEIEARLPVLDRELGDAEERYRTLVVPDFPSPMMQAELLRWRKMITALPQEKAEWVAKLRQVAEDLAAMESLRKSLMEARSRHDKRDQECVEEIAARQRAKRKVEKQIEGLEKTKTDPYREIGRVLADQKIGPLNQPEALAVVLEQRKKIAALEAAITASLAASAREGRTVA